MSEETRGLAIKDKVEVNDNSRKISVEESTSQVGQTVVQDEKVCQSIVFDNEQMKSSKFTVERSSCRSKVTREQTTLSENTSGNDSNLLIFAVHQRNTEVELASSGTEGPVADLAQVANNQEVHDKRTSLETQTALRSVLDNCSTSSQNDTCGGPDFDRRCQTITVSKGKAITDKFSGEICNFSDFEHSSRDGLFWKLSEFHRRSGKQGLESRFELLSPTIIVDCSAFFRDQATTEAQTISSCSSREEDENFDRQTDTYFDKETDANSPSKNTDRSQPRQDSNRMMDSELISVAGDRDKTCPFDQKMENSQDLKASSSEIQDRDSSTGIRNLRKRKAVDYFPKKKKNTLNSKLLKSECEESIEDPLTVLYWYKDIIQTFKDSGKIKFLNKHHKDLKMNGKILRLKKDNNHQNLSKLVRTKVKTLAGTSISLHSFPDTLNSLPPKAFGFTVSVNDQDDFEVSNFLAGKGIYNCIKFDGIFEADLAKHAVTKDFDIDSLLQEMGISPENSVYDCDELCEKHEKSYQEQLPNMHCIDSSKENIMVTSDRHSSKGNISVCSNRYNSSSKNSVNKNGLSSGKTTIICQSSDNSTSPSGGHMEDGKESLKKCNSIEVINTEVLNMYLEGILPGQKETLDEAELNTKLKEDDFKGQVRVQKRTLRDLSPVNYFPQVNKQINKETDKRRKINKSKDIKNSKEGIKTNRNTCSGSGMTAVSLADILYLSNNTQEKQNIKSKNQNIHTIETDTISNSYVDEQICFGKETCSLQTVSDVNERSHVVTDGVLDMQFKPSDLRANRLSECSKSQLNCLPQKHERTKSVPRNIVKTKIPGRSRSRKNSSSTTDTQKSVCSPNALEESTNIQAQSLNQNSHIQLTDSEELLDLLESNVMIPKMVLRKHSPVTYFPDKKRQNIKKSKDSVKNSSSQMSKLKARKLDENFIPGIAANNGSHKKCKQKQMLTSEDTDILLNMSDLSSVTFSAEVLNVEMRTNDQMLNVYDGGVAEIMGKHVNAEGITSVTDLPKFSDECVFDKSMIPENIDKEKEANVLAALAGLYKAENVKEGSSKSLLSDRFMNNTAEMVSEGHAVGIEKGSDVQKNAAVKEIFDMNYDQSISVGFEHEPVLEEGQENMMDKNINKEKHTICNSNDKESKANSQSIFPCRKAAESETSCEKIYEECLLTAASTKVPVNGRVEESLSLSDHHSIKQTKETVDKKVFPVGTVVWGRFSKARWWPAIVVTGRMLKRETRPGCNWVFWLSDNKVSQLKNNQIELFTSHYSERTSGLLTESMKIGMLKALKVCAEHAQIDHSSFQSIEEWGQSTSGFIQQIIDENAEAVFPPDEAAPLPLFVLDQLGIIKKRVFDDSSLAAPDTVETELKKKGKEAKEKTKKVPINEGQTVPMCLSCDLPLNDDNQVYQHPLFEGTICKKCKDGLMSSFYAIDDDGCSLMWQYWRNVACHLQKCNGCFTQLFCGICGEGGKLFVCEKELCGRAFCFSCVERHSGQQLVNQIKEINPWHCFLCSSYSIFTHGNLSPRKDWQLETVKFFQTDNIPLCNDLDYMTADRKRKIRVLSLFDGIGTGKLVLNELGLDVEVYYASEINTDAMLVASYHHRVTHVGDAAKLTRAQLAKLCPIDLVIGGPPCNDLSIVNPLRKGFNGTGMLLLKFVTILKDIETLCKGRNHVFWLLENTGSMLTDFKQVICTLLGMEPAIWDAKYFTGQRRARSFWGNIPGLYSTPEFCKQLEQERKDLDAALISNCNRRALISHMRTITTGTNSLTVKNGREGLPIEMNGVEDGIWVMEMERLFGFPEHYTDVGHLSRSVRHKLLGKSWCVPVIKHILSPLKQYFALKES